MATRKKVSVVKEPSKRHEIRVSNTYYITLPDGYKTEVTQDEGNDLFHALSEFF